MIEIKNLTKKYEDITIFENANYVLPNTGLVCLLGESGSGKSTLIRMLAGLDKDYSGDIIVNKTKIKDLNKDELCDYRKDYIGFVFQDYQLLKGYTSLENILYPCALNESDKIKDAEYARKLLSDFGLSEKANVKIQNLSGGQKQRVAIARALIKNPEIILADEPTGALDRRTSNEIMQILKEISKNKLVFIITHDYHICEYADEIISIEDRKINVKETNTSLTRDKAQKLELKSAEKINFGKLAIKNYKVSFLKYFLIAFTFAIGILCFILSLSSGRIMQKEIQDFENKNTAFNNIYIKNNENIEELYNVALNDDRIENVYKQYKINDVSLSVNEYTEIMNEKYPMPKATENMSYGVMPRMQKNEVALSPSLAKKFATNISELIGKELILKYNGESYSLTISGIYNAGYDDFFVSSDIEQKLYKQVENENYYAISFDVKKFKNIAPISEKLLEKDIKASTAKDEVKTIQTTFEKITRLFVVISVIILAICIFIVSILLMKLRQTRVKMIKLLSVFGFNKKAISKLVALENILLVGNSILLTSIFVGITYLFI